MTYFSGFICPCFCPSLPLLGMASLRPLLSNLSSVHIEILLGRPSTPGAISLPPPHWGIIQFDSRMAECVLLACPPELQEGAEAEPVPVHGELRLMVQICLVPELQGGKPPWNGITQISMLRTSYSTALLPFLQGAGTQICH